MKFHIISVCTAALLLTACSEASETADRIARDQAKNTVNTVVEQRFPGVNVAPVTDCIIDAASAQEILTLASATVTGVTDETVADVVEIAQRPEALECIANNSLTLLGL